MKEVKKIMKKVINNTTMFALYVIIIELMFKLIVGTLRFDYSLLRIILSSFVISYIFNLIKNRTCKKFVFCLLTIVITVYGIAQLGFNNFLGGYMSINTSSQLGKVTDYISEYIASFKFSYYTLLIPTIFYLIYLFTNKNLKDSFNKKTLVILPILMIGYYITLTAGFMQNKYQYVSNLSLFRRPSIASVSVNQFGYSVFGLLDVNTKLFGIEEATAMSNDIDVSEIEVKEGDTDAEILNYLISTETNNNLNMLNKYFYSRESNENSNMYSGIFKDKNLILVLMESVGELAYNEEYFPTLYKLYNEGITFTNNYSPRTSCSTGNNEFSTLTSMFAISNMCTTNIYKANSYVSSIFNIFNDANYNTSAFHDYDEKYYFRSTYLTNMGAGIYKDVTGLGIDYSTIYEEWPSDTELIKKSYPIFSATTDTSSKFMTYLVTVTPHQPYSVSSELGDKHLDELKDLDAPISIKRYYSKMMELDQALSDLITNLENDGTLDDTVIVLFGDHYPYGIKTSELQTQFDYDLEENNEIERTPFIIYNSATSSRKVENYTTYMDILPTLANLFGLDYDSRFYMGKDALAAGNESLALFPDGSWQSKYAFYDAETSKLNYIDNSYTYTDTEIAKINQDINQKITMSNLAITENYFYYFKTKKEMYDNGTLIVNNDVSEEIE